MRAFNPFSGTKGCFEGKQGVTSSDLNYMLLKQVHGDKIHVMDSHTSPAQIHFQEGDAILCTEKNIPIAVKTADCVPVLLAHPDGIIGAIHAGWRGTRLKILEKVLLKIQNEFKKDLSRIHLAIGPAICGECYEVGEEVASEFDPKYLKKNSRNKYLLDLKMVNYDMAILGGVLESQIQVLKDCTLCHPEIYYSYRYESQNGLSKEGRNYSWIMRI